MVSKEKTAWSPEEDETNFFMKGIRSETAERRESLSLIPQEGKSIQKPIHRMTLYRKQNSWPRDNLSLLDTRKSRPTSWGEITYAVKRATGVRGARRNLFRKGRTWAGNSPPRCRLMTGSIKFPHITQRYALIQSSPIPPLTSKQSSTTISPLHRAQFIANPPCESLLLPDFNRCANASRMPRDSWIWRKTDKDENNCRKRRDYLKKLDEWDQSTIFGMNLTNSTCILR